MKTKTFLFSFFLISHLSFLTSQIPQGFNYQAIARGSDGKEIANTTMQVKVSILSDTTGFYAGGTGTFIWEEQQTIKTNSLGLFTLTIGNISATKVQGSAASFSEIDWKQQPLFIGTKINNGTWKNMGTSKLGSVPYAMVARDVKGLSKLQVVGNTASLDSALFEVKNKNGQTVFAVYNEGVRVYVDDGVAKGKKGGFAIGGFGTAKAPSQQYLLVKPDTIRMYIDDTPGKAGKGGFAIGGFGKAKGAADFLNVATDAGGLINPSQNRVLWYPIKNAFLVGKVLIEHPDSVGLNSFASGYESKAKGNYSEAFGYRSAARGDFSTAMGYQSSAKGSYSVALGYSSVASGNYSFAMGINTRATGLNSFALGDGSVAIGSWTYAFGYHNTATNGGPTYAFGDGTLADHWGATSFGWQTKAQATHSTVLGEHTTSVSYTSLVIGKYNIVSGDPINWIPSDPEFVIGNGTSYANPGNAFSVLKNGNTFVGGTLGVGTSSAQAKLEVQVSGFDGYSGIGIKSTISGGKLITINQGIAGKLNFTTPGIVDLVTMDFNTNRMGIMRSPTSYTLEVGGTIWANGSTISAGSTVWSDARYKYDIIPLSGSLEDVLKMEGVRYQWRRSEFPDLNFPEGEQIGVIAQEMEKIVPQVVYTGPDGYKSVSYEKLVPVLIEAIKEQQKQIDELKAMLNQLMEEKQK
jgi:hypothetical protein